MSEFADFRKCFKALTDHDAFHWQCELYKKLRSGLVPVACDLPTGAGKTSVIPIWLIALVDGGGRQDCCVPRRLVYVVNRRTVVDQSTEVVNEIRKRISQASGSQLESLRDRLSVMSSVANGKEELIAVSTLRGEMADNGQWRLDPARPAIVIGTVDMIGSKLLFRGYGDGRYFRSHHAGLLGRDTLFVHDESHLSPAFESLLRSISEMQSSTKSNEAALRGVANSLRVLNLTATSAATTVAAQTLEGGSSHDVIRVDNQLERKELLDRLSACKHLRLRAEDSAADVLKSIQQFVLDHASIPCRILVYVQKPEDAVKTAKSLRSNSSIDAEQVKVLTGIMRGHERDSLANSDVARWFAGGDALDKAVIIVSTSAGEVGVDWDADHLVSNLSTLESMIQRFGRVNRRGGKNRVADLLVVGNRNAKDGEPRLIQAESKPSGRDGRLWETWRALESIPFVDADGADDSSEGEVPPRDASPLSLRALAGRVEAYSETPIIPELLDVLIDAWAQTSFGTPLPNQPPVADWLHGRTDQPEPPETIVAWREEVTKLATHANIDQIKRAFRAFPLRTSERLRNHTDRVVKHLKQIAERKANSDGACDKFALLIRDGKSVEWLSTAEMLAGNKADRERFRDRLAFATVILPASGGGLTGGMLDGGNPEHVSDVAEAHSDGHQRRRRVLVSDGIEDRPLLEQTAAESENDTEDSALVTAYRIRLGDDEFADEDQEIATLEYRVEKRNAEFALGSPASTLPEPLATHVDAVVAHVDAIATKLNLPPAIKEVLRLAAENHDLGKNREIWQLAARNPEFTKPIAKSGRSGFDGRALQGYRHEFGSVLETVSAPQIARHEERDLILHLIASHHGWARPHFEQCAADGKYSSSQNEQAMIAVTQRYSRLQQRFGHWTLAWLESLLRCADGLASAGIAPCDQTPAELEEASV